MDVASLPPGHTDLHSYLKVARGLSGDAFALRHQGGVLVLHRGQLSSPSTLGTPALPPVDVTADIVFSAIAVGKRGAGNPHPDVTVGRTANNDVVLPDTTVSQFHAYFRLSDNGVLLIDAGSRNGTFIDGARVASRSEGEPAVVKSKTSIRFGSVTLTYLLAPDFVDFATRLAAL